MDTEKLRSFTNAQVQEIKIESVGTVAESMIVTRDPGVKGKRVIGQK